MARKETHRWRQGPARRRRLSLRRPAARRPLIYGAGLTAIILAEAAFSLCDGVILMKVYGLPLATGFAITFGLFVAGYLLLARRDVTTALTLAAYLVVLGAGVGLISASTPTQETRRAALEAAPLAEGAPA